MILLYIWWVACLTGSLEAMAPKKEKPKLRIVK